jgi:cation transport ATPase
MMSEVLDDERKEAFLQALQGLKEEQENAAKRERELQKQQREQLEEQRRVQEQQRIAEAKRAEEEARRREEARKYPQRPPDASPTSGGASSSKSRPTPGSPTARPDTNRPSRAIPSKKNQVSRQRNNSQPTLYKRAAAIFAGLQTLVLNMGQSLASNPMALMRMLLFLLMFALAFGRRDIRERVKRMLRKAWEKVTATVGMGTKVSYI